MLMITLNYMKFKRAAPPPPVASEVRPLWTSPGGGGENGIRRKYVEICHGWMHVDKST